MKIEIKKVEDLIPYHNNPIIHSPEQIDVIAKSIKDFGWKVPLVIDSDNVIIAGHGRLIASKQLKLKEVPCIIADDLTDEQVRKFRLVDNQSAKLNEFDFEILELELGNLDDMEDFGFEDLSLKDEYGEDFSLPDGDKEPFQQMTFTLADAQVEQVQSALAIARQDNYIETYGNENSNGNSLFRIVKEWVEQKK